MNSSRMIDPVLNWHLSAMKISQATINILTDGFDFARDEFANNTHCETTVYHGTFKGSTERMTRSMWNDIVAVLASDKGFEGDLEEEMILPQYVFSVSNIGEDARPIREIERKQIQPCPVGIYKECDLHLKVTWDKTHESVKQALDSIGMISFDRHTNDQGTFNRIYTLTFESLRDGLTHLEHLKEKLTHTKGIEARLKLEIATCFYRQPGQAVVLPIVLKHNSK